MKKTAFILVLLSFSFLCLSASAQQRNFLNHAALGVSLGIDGVGIEAAVPVSPFLQVRGGYSLMPFTYSRNLNLGRLTVNNESRDISNLPATFSVWNGGLGNAMLDIFPGRSTSFRVVAGLYFGSGKMAGFKADLRNVLEPEDYRTGVGYKGVTVSTDADGYGYIDARIPKVLPYLGLGFGRSVHADKPVTFTFELGAAYTGGIQFVSYDYSNPSGVQTSVITSKQLTDDNGKQVDQGIVDKVSGIPVLPMMKFSLFVRLF